MVGLTRDLVVTWSLLTASLSIYYSLRVVFETWNQYFYLLRYFLQSLKEFNHSGVKLFRFLFWDAARLISLRSFYRRIVERLHIVKKYVVKRLIVPRTIEGRSFYIQNNWVCTWSTSHLITSDIYHLFLNYL
jgi:hypothetical protein